MRDELCSTNPTDVHPAGTGPEHCVSCLQHQLGLERVRTDALVLAIERNERDTIAKIISRINEARGRSDSPVSPKETK